VKLIKYAGTQNVADALTKSLPRPAFHNHREFLKVEVKSFCSFFASAHEPNSQLRLRDSCLPKMETLCPTSWRNHGVHAWSRCGTRGCFGNRFRDGVC
jgi:hypothetical protein